VAAVIDWDPLVAAAGAARRHAHAPYSGFAVGAALRTAEGAVFAGCNVENRSYGLTICAERNAVTSAVAAGCRDPVAIVVLTPTSPPSPPCGMCLETLREFAADLPVLLTNPAGERVELALSQLLPVPFELPPLGSRG
jgi:cytidine deaminase